MAGFDDLNPFGTPDAATNPQGGSILDQWGAALQNPSTRASLMQMGLQMMQPMGFGQSPMGHLAQAIGAGGEAGTRVEEQDLKENLTAAKLAQSGEASDIARARLGIYQQNADTKAAAQKARGAGGGVSATTLFRAQDSQNRQMQQDAARIGRDTVKQLADADLFNPGSVPPALARYRGKRADDIAAELLSDPNWTGKWKQNRGMAAGASVPPPAQRQVDQVYQTPKGPMVWKGNGWAPAKGVPAGAPADDNEDEI